MRGLSVLFFGFLWISNSGVSQLAEAAVSPGTPVQLPLTFEPNRGQAAAAGADFIGRGSEYTLLVGRREYAIQPVMGSGSRPLTLQWGGISKSTSQGRALELLPGTTNFLGARAALSGIPQYGRVRYDQLYPGIDIEYYGQAGRMEFDLLVQPHADVRQVRLRLQEQGAAWQLTAEGDRRISLPNSRQTFVRGGRSAIR